MENFNDIFNLDADDFVEKAETKKSDLYSADPKKGKDNTYKSLIRFVPYFKDPKKSKIKKFGYWLTNPITGDSFPVDCPSTIGQKSILQDTFWKLKKSPSISEQKLSDKFKRKESYFAIIQVIKDENNPEAVGKFFPFKFGQKLNNIIQSELQPEYGAPCNPFDPFKGRIMALNVTIVAGFNNYDTSKFVGDGTPIQMDGAPITEDKKCMEKFVAYLEANSPDLSKYFYKEWDDETREKIKAVIENTVPSLRNIETMGNEMSKNSGRNISLENSSAPKRESAPSADIKELTLDDLNLDEGLSESDDFNDSLYADL